MAETVRPHGYHVVISYFDENPELERNEAESLLARQVDGLILASAQPGAKAFADMQKRKVPFVLIDRPIAGVQASFVGVDNQAIGQLATAHLIERGCRRIAHLRGPGIGIATGRMQGYRSALAKRGLPFYPGYVVDAGYQDDSGHEAMLKLLKKKPVPDGVFCYNDPVAIGAMRAISEAGPAECPRTLPSWERATFTTRIFWLCPSLPSTRELPKSANAPPTFCSSASLRSVLSGPAKF